MKTVRLMFSTTHWPLSAVIRAFTWSRWSHVAVIDGDTVIEAVAVHGVRRAPLKEAIERASDFALVDLPARSPEAVIEAAASQLGKPYDYSALVGLALHREWQDDGAWFCSELVAWAFDAAAQPLIRPEL
ncbi:YiiX/YebB-like N1pC/P60 family cysteine hydrolase [Cupriavidus plantarum]|uniref:YiiX/YebB-like N1pC/P60 family cysteine hydrolase n=1 Tax=Cupriavidus plantarum TaxID=942865 RepID=UPI000E227EC2|nr:YiiX/YebB-like N1pC/P60 family cysteine hydrolase [Cupriavidus plantarum]